MTRRSALGDQELVRQRDSLLRRTFSLPVEMALIGLVLAVWQAARIPLEGSSDVALAHGRSWLALERVLHLDGEAALIRLVHRSVLLDAAGWFYANVHVAAIVGFLAVARVVAPGRYPKLRSAFALAHLPALAVIGLYPLASPSWLQDLPFAAGPPTDGDLHGTLTAALRNQTAAAASMHFGYPVLIAGASLWIAPRRPLSWATLALIPFTFLAIVGTGHHFVLDAGVGAACVALGAAVAHHLHGPARAGSDQVKAGRGEALLAGGGYLLLGYAVNRALLGQLPLDRPSSGAVALALGVLVAVLTRGVRPWEERPARPVPAPSEKGAGRGGRLARPQGRAPLHH